MPSAELYLSIDPDTTSCALLQHLPPLLALPEVTALRLPTALTLSEHSCQRLIKELHKHDVALILAPSGTEKTIPPYLLKVADGLHTADQESLLHWRKKYPDALQIGTYCHTRDEAMQAGEHGADYIAFAHTETDLLTWWASVAELPSVADGVSTPESALAAQNAHADFLDVRLTLDGHDAARLDAFITAIATFA